MQSKRWRIVAVAALSPGGWSVNTLHLYGPSGRLDTSAVISSSVEPSQGAVSSLTNAAPGAAVVWSAAQVDAPGFYLMWTFPADVEISELRYAGAPLGCFTVEAMEGGVWRTVRNVLTVTDVSATSTRSWPLYTRPNLDGAAAYLPGDTNIDGVTGAAWQLDGATIDSNNSRGGLPTLKIKAPSSVSYPGPMSIFTNWIGQDMTIEARVWCTTGAVYLTGIPLFIFSGDAAPGVNYWSFGPRPDGSVAFYYWSGEQNLITTAAGIYPFGSYVRIAISVVQKVLRIFLNGRMVLSYPMTATPMGGNNATPVRVGGAHLPSEFHVSDVVFTPSGKYTADYVDEESWDRPPLPITQKSLAQVLCSSPLEPHRSSLLPGAIMARDTEFGGQGSYPFKVEGLPGSQKARVSLLRARDRLLARETWSAADGTGAFTGLDLGTKFIAVAQDPSGLLHPCGAEHFPELPDTTGGA